VLGRMGLIDEMRLLDAEHGKLKDIASLLESQCLRIGRNRPCDDCTETLLAACADVANDALVDLLNFSMLHTEHEERIMKCLCPAQEFMARFADHLEDHANLSGVLTRLAGKPPSTPPSVMIGDLVKLTHRWMGDHLSKFDSGLIEAIETACLEHSRPALRPPSVA
jgi:hemerythrin